MIIPNLDQIDARRTKYKETILTLTKRKKADDISLCYAYCLSLQTTSIV